MGGLSVASLFTFSFADPAARLLLNDPDPQVAASARSALDAIAGGHRAQQLAGDSSP